MSKGLVVLSVFSVGPGYPSLNRILWIFLIADEELIEGELACLFHHFFLNFRSVNRTGSRERNIDNIFLDYFGVHESIC